MSVRELRNFVNGEYVDSRSEARLDLIDPATEAVYATSPVSNAADVDDAYRTKYGPAGAESMVTSTAAETTLRLSPE